MIRNLVLAAPLLAWSVLAPAAPPVPAPQPVSTPFALSPGEIVAAAPAAAWSTIAPADLLVMSLAPDARAKPRRVVIQLIPAPFSQGWVGNIRRLAAVRWWDGTSVNRVQDNYVVQWGDADGEDKARAKPLPAGLAVMPERAYEVAGETGVSRVVETYRALRIARAAQGLVDTIRQPPAGVAELRRTPVGDLDPYGPLAGFWDGWPVATDLASQVWPVHCYGMVGVGRNLSPDTGSGAELYTVIGTPPRHLDRNIAIVGRVIEGIEYLSSLPRGTGALGFYETAAGRTPIVSVRLGNEVANLPAYQYLTTESETFARYADARANRRDPFFIRPAGGADICNIPVPVRRVSAAK